MKLFGSAIDTATPWPWARGGAACRRRLLCLSPDLAPCRGGMEARERRGSCRIAVPARCDDGRRTTADAPIAARWSCATCTRASASTPIIRGVSLDVSQGRAARDHRAQRRRQVDAVQSDQRTLRAHQPGRSASTARDRGRRAPFAIYRRGLARSFQVTNIFPRLSVYENIRCSVLWSLGYRYNFWRSVYKLRDANERTETNAGADRLTARRDTPAGVLTYAEQRALEIGITIAGDAERDPARRADGRHEPQRNRRRGRADPLGHAGPDTGDGRARHGRGLRSGRSDLRAGVRRDHRHRRARIAFARTRPCRRRISVPQPMLEIDNVHAYYGKSHILQGISLSRRRGRDRQPARTQRRGPLDDRSRRSWARCPPSAAFASRTNGSTD